MPFTGIWVHNFEIRVGESSELENNDICYKQFDYFDDVQTNVSCSHELYGDLVSINSTYTLGVKEYLALREVRVFGSKNKGEH